MNASFMGKKTIVLSAIVLAVVLLTTPALAAPTTITYVVQPGDTLWEIAQRLNTTVRELKANNGLQGDMILPGQKLVAQAEPSANDKSAAYSVKKGDTLWQIARRTGTTVEALKRANNLAGSLIYPGQILKLPGSTCTETNINRDLEWLARVISAEARGESLQGQIAVGAVVMNRVQDRRFPDSVYEVIFQSGQFTSVDNGSIYRTPTASAYRAARLALAGFDPTGGSVYFYNPRLVSRGNWIRSRPVIKTIGNHDFAA